MSDAHAHGSGECVFTPSDVKYFQAQDFSAAKAVVVLMCGIFSLGIVIYSIVLSVVAAQG